MTVVGNEDNAFFAKVIVNVTEAENAIITCEIV